MYYIVRRKLTWKPRLSTVSLPTDFDNFPPSLKLETSIPAANSFLGENNFVFLNIPHHFSHQIDWNFAEHGKLWTYNLNYFEFLSQADLTKETGLNLIQEYISIGEDLQDGLEPFPISLRTIFWIKFLVKHNVKDKNINAFLFRQVKLLEQQLEYHLLGNHLLENGFALLFAAYYFSNQQMLRKAKKILLEQLDEQILSDGAHFEISPMYHQLILYRLLDSINLVKNNSEIFTADCLSFLTKKATAMLSWIDYMSFSDGTVPHFNDSTEGIAPNTNSLKTYANRLEISYERINDNICSLNYQKYKSSQYEIFVDIGDIGPDYIPGHAHSDNLHFVLHNLGSPLLVDTGISTYEKNQKRHSERSTTAHNTVQIGTVEQSDVWGGFRVGRRAKPIEKILRQSEIKGAHDGYSFLGIQHERTFKLQEKTIEIIDTLSIPAEAKARFHFHPSVKVVKKSDALVSVFACLTFKNATLIELEEYDFAEGYNKTQKAIVALVHFNKHLHTTIKLE